MNVTIESIIAIFTFLMSVVALFFAVRKQKHDVFNADADTIKNLLESVKMQEQRYSELKAEFDNYKKSMNSQFTDISAENVKLRNWARRLCAQLEAHSIVPARFDGDN
jgi:uncharacterized protein YlxW (UPF0749 family)